jgi:glycosyl transferase family 25
MNAFIITLVDQELRLRNAEAMAFRLLQQGLNPTIMPATRLGSREFSEIDYAASKSLERPMTAGEIACSWSHYLACKLILESGQSGFVFEDDARLLRDMSAVNLEGVEEILSGSAYDPNCQRDGFVTLSTNWERGHHYTEGLPYGTQGYFLTVEGAKVLVENLLPIRWASDVALDRLSKNGILQAQLAIEPWAVQHGDIQSHIGPR